MFNVNLLQILTFSNKGFFLQSFVGNFDWLWIFHFNVLAYNVEENFRPLCANVILEIVEPNDKPWNATYYDLWWISFTLRKFSQWVNPILSYKINMFHHTLHYTISMFCASYIIQYASLHTKDFSLKEHECKNDKQQNTTQIDRERET